MPAPRTADRFATQLTPPFAVIAALLTFTTFGAAPLLAQATNTRHTSIAVEADAIAYGLHGYSGILSISLRNGLQFAAGTGRYDVPSFLLSGDDNYDIAKWKATSTSVQVVRATYRLNGPMKSGLAVGGIVLNQNWRLRSSILNGESTFRPLSAGLTTGYYIHLSKHFYVFPTAAFTWNKVVSGKAGIGDVSYKVQKFAPNGSVHVGWEWTR